MTPTKKNTATARAWEAYRDTLAAFRAQPTDAGARAVLSSQRAFLELYLDSPAEVARQHDIQKARLQACFAKLNPKRIAA